MALGGPIIKNRLHFSSRRNGNSVAASDWSIRRQTRNEDGIVAADSIEAIRQALASRFDVGASARYDDNP